MSATETPAPSAGAQRGAPLLGADTVTWRVNREPIVFLGGGRALLLQVAHPLVAAGVEQHSNYEEDPWGRLVRTLDTAVKIVFGPPDTSARAARRLRRRHDRVKGTSPDGVAYDAQDPELLIWVWATLVDTARMLYERCFGTLPPADRERYYQEQKLFAYECGVPEGACPETDADFETYVRRMVAEGLRVTDGARRVAHQIRNPAVPAPVQPALGRPIALLTAGLLPPPLREDYGFEWNGRRQRAFERALSAVCAAQRVVPRPLREQPVALVAAGRTDRLMARLLR